MNKLLCSFAILSLLCGCVSSSSHVLVGNQHPAINPSQVKLYLHPPAKYEEVALLSANSRYVFFASSDQHKMNVAIENLKEDAAKLGANGILLTGTGDESGGSVGTGFGSATAYGTGNSATAFGSGTTVAAPIVFKAASGIAIYVTQE